MKKNVLVATLTVFLAISLVVVALNIISSLPLLKVRLYGAKAVATVVDKTWDSGEGRRVVYQFEVSGTKHRGISPASEGLWTQVDIGSALEVRYDVTDPSRSVLSRTDLKTGGAVFQLLLSLVFLLLIGYGLHRALRLRRIR